MRGKGAYQRTMDRLRLVLIGLVAFAALFMAVSGAWSLVPVEKSERYSLDDRARPEVVPMVMFPAHDEVPLHDEFSGERIGTLDRAVLVRGIVPSRVEMTYGERVPDRLGWAVLGARTGFLFGAGEVDRAGLVAMVAEPRRGEQIASMLDDYARLGDGVSHDAGGVEFEQRVQIADLDVAISEVGEGTVLVEVEASDTCGCWGLMRYTVDRDGSARLVECTYRDHQAVVLRSATGGLAGVAVGAIGAVVVVMVVRRRGGAVPKERPRRVWARRGRA